MHNILHPKGMSRDLFKFWEISDNISEMVQVRRSCNVRLTGSHVAYRIAPLPMPLKITFAVSKLYKSHSS